MFRVILVIKTVFLFLVTETPLIYLDILGNDETPENIGSEQ